jgi:ABC-2 type transport system permease protein
MNWFRDCYFVFRQGFTSLLRSKATYLMFAFALLYVLVVAIAMRNGGDRMNQNRLFAQVTLGFFIMIIIPLVATYFGVASVRDEISQGTLLHLLVRPVPRTAIWIGKYLSAWMLGMLLLSLAFGIAVALAEAMAPQAGFGRAFKVELTWPFVQALIYGPLVYPAIGLFFGLRFRWSMVWALAFILIWEDFVSVTPSGSGARTLTISDSMRTLIYHASDAQGDLRQMLSRFDLQEGAVEIPTASSARITMAWFFFLALGLACWSGARREFVSSEKET